MTKIGIIGQQNDEEVIQLKKEIKKLGGTPIIIDFKEFPKKEKLTITEKSIKFNNLELLAIPAFYLRQLGYFWPIPQIELTKAQWMKYYKKYNENLIDERENLSVKHSMIRILSMETFLVNPYECFMYHRLKPLQFYLLAKNGFKIPLFLSTSDPAEMQRFIKKQSSVCKPNAGGAEVKTSEDFIKENDGIITRRALLFQKRIIGRDIRAFATSDEFIGAAEIIHGPQIDYRVETKDVKPITLPEEIKERTLQAMETLNLRFSGVDYIYDTQEDQYYLLECNPSPMFYVFEKISRINVSKKLAGYLLKNAKR